MKKIISLLLSVVMLCSVLGGITAQAAVRYDKDKASDTATYKMLNIYGRNYYKYAFDCLTRVNKIRTDAGSAKLSMDKDLLDAAMLKAHETYVLYDLDRPNGEDWEYIVDTDSPQLYFQMLVATTITDCSKEVGDHWANGDYKDYVINADVKCAGIGCFKPEDSDLTFWILFLSCDKAGTKVTASDYSTSVSKKETIALHKNYWDGYFDQHKHTYVLDSTDVPADAGKKTNGKQTKRCKVCGHTTKTTLSYPKTVMLSSTSYAYDGKAHKPTVTVKDAKGNKIASKYYSIKYASGCKNVGKYTVTVTFKDAYKGSLKKSFTIKPKATSISSIAAKKKGFTVKWKKVATQTKGYQVQYSTSASFKSPKTVTIGKNSTVSKSVTGLKKRTRYYVRVRTYMTVSGTKYYSAWSKSRNVITN